MKNYRKEKITGMIKNALCDIFAELQEEEGIMDGCTDPWNGWDLEEAVENLTDIVNRIILYQEHVNNLKEGFNRKK